MTTSAWFLLATSTPTPGPSPTAVVGPDPDLVTPGVAGFLVTFLLAVATILLLRSMTYHLRKVRYSPDPAAEDAGDAEAAEDARRDGRPEPTSNGADRT